MVLNAAQLQAIAQEARTCFLFEDAPDYLAAFEQGIAQLRLLPPSATSSPVLTDLMRVAHSLKGGAGIAQLSGLSQLAHKLEDVLQALSDQRVPEPGMAYELLDLSLEHMQELIAEAIAGQPSAKDSAAVAASPIMVALEQFLGELPQPQANTAPEASSGLMNAYLVKTALEVDLEDCLKRLEQSLQAPPSAITYHAAFTAFVEECTLLGQALNLAWLSTVVAGVGEVAAAPEGAIRDQAIALIAEIRHQRSQFLNPSSAKTTPAPELLPLTEASTPTVSTNEPLGVTETPTLNLRIPVTRLDRMSNTVGELLINHERLFLYQAQLQQANLTLKQRTQQLDPISDQVRAFYDRLATPLASSIMTATPAANGTIADEFDSLEFDRYTELHGTLQDFQELMVQVQETRTDIDLINRDLQEALEQLRQQLDDLRGDLTESRLVPFRTLAERFAAPLQGLNRRYNKSVALVVLGSDTLVDQVILEQLHTPLTHLIRNAFDHGIELPQERQALDKSPTACITLSARGQGNQVIIEIQDDGRGIDTQKIYRRAIALGLCSTQAHELAREEILDFMFAPGFSTASQVTDLSGRGVGLDIVKLHVNRLRGSIRVQTSLGQGTTFAIAIPLTLSILPLLLCRCQQRTLAIPSTDVLEIIDLKELGVAPTSVTEITWHHQTIPVMPLLQLLPYPSNHGITSASGVTAGKPLGIVLEVENNFIAVAVDALLGERELVLKPFDATIPVPAYLSGCTVLGSGEVVPVLSPPQLGPLLTQSQQAKRNSQGVPPTPIKLTEATDRALTVLIVDDSIAVRRLLERVLTQAGYQVVQCRDGKDALETLNRSGEAFNLMISDIEMPRLDGFGLLKEVRMHSHWHSLPVAMLTSRENDRHRQKAMSLGATSYFTKPFNPTDLLQAIAQQMS